ncbi:MAG TPA: ABC transporter permease subunit [Stellaceae bacterium]|nr:ABC transporter permease subunit [Stellaceae bacterium]
MGTVGVIFRREFLSYFATPLAYVFIVIFLLLAGGLTYYQGGFFERGQADLIPFFSFHPWLYLFLIPALSMRLWAEERKSGTIEWLLTLPVTTGEAVIAKFLAAWAFTAVALILTFPFWLTVNYLGDPDNGVILACYLGSLLMAGGFLAIGGAISALTRSQVIAFVVSAVICFLFTATGAPIVLGPTTAWLPPYLVEAITSLSFIAHFDSITRGLIDLRDIVFFLSVICLFLFANTLIIEAKKAS